MWDYKFFGIICSHIDIFDGDRKYWLVFSTLSLLLISVCSCNFPVSTPTGTPNPGLVSNSGPPTWTPFFPSEPTAITPSPAVLTITPPAPSLTPTFSFGTWPPPYFGNPGPAQVTAIPAAFPPLSGKETVNFLLVGSDRRALSFRTDTLVVVSFRPRDQSVSMISIPRDLYVYIPGWKMQRINTAYQQGELIQPGYTHRSYRDGGIQRLPPDRRHPGRDRRPSGLCFHRLAHH